MTPKFIALTTSEGNPTRVALDTIIRYGIMSAWDKANVSVQYTVGDSCHVVTVEESVEDIDALIEEATEFTPRVVDPNPDIAFRTAEEGHVWLTPLKSLRGWKPYSNPAYPFVNSKITVINHDGYHQDIMVRATVDEIETLHFEMTASE